VITHGDELLVLTVTQAEDGEKLVISAQLGDGAPIAETKPWMFEAVVGALDYLQTTQKKMARDVLKRFCDQAATVRRNRKQMKVVEMPEKKES